MFGSSAGLEVLLLQLESIRTRTSDCKSGTGDGTGTGFDNTGADFGSTGNSTWLNPGNFGTYNPHSIVSICGTLLTWLSSVVIGV